MTAYDMGDLRSYVRTDNTGMQARAESTVLLGVSHSNLKLTKFLEIRLDCHMSIERVKEKLMAHTGTSAAASRLTLKDCAGNAVAEMNDDSKKLGFYSPQNGWVICIMDTDEYSLSLNGGLDDVTNVKKYEMSDEDYERRDNTYRAFKAKKLAADPTWTLEKEMAGRNPASAAALAAKEATRIDDT
jgi:tubulin-folding cofactor B